MLSLWLGNERWNVSRAFEFAPAEICPGLTPPPTRSRVSAALFSRDAGDRRASLGELLPDCYSYQKPLRVSFTVQVSGSLLRYATR